MLRLIVLIATLLYTCSALALLPPHPRPLPRIEVPAGAETPIRLQQLSIETRISGAMAETTVRMVFFNPNLRALEGTLQFPLLDGQQITGFALDIEGAMRPAVPVEKAKGREVFEAIQRRRVDPGLLEVTQGNNFKLRIFPINAGATRTAEIRYAEPLRRADGQLHYRLPLEYGKVDNFELHIDTSGKDAPPSVRGLRDLSFVPHAGGYRARFTRQGFDPSGEVDIALGMAEGPRAYRQQFNGETYFVAEIPVASTPVRRPTPRVVGLLWDASSSGARRDLAAELAVLDRYFAALGDVEVRLTRLRDRAEPPLAYSVRGGDWSALRRELQRTVYDGATVLGGWQAERAVDEYLLFSDGLQNYGAAPMPQLAPQQRLMALNSASAADTARLAGLAARFGGELIAIDSQAPAQAADALLFEQVRVQDVDVRGALDVVFESRTVQDGMLRAAGRLAGPGQLAVTLVQQGRTRLVNVPLDAAMPAHPLAAHTWASLRLRELDADPGAHRGEITRLGKKFGIPTRETSLIVLEQLADYVTYDIEPPASIAQAVAQLRAGRGASLREARTKQLEQVVELYGQRIAWWQRDFSKARPAPGKRKPRAERAAKVELQAGEFATADLMPPPPPFIPPAQPAPMMAPAPAPATVSHASNLMPRVAAAPAAKASEATPAAASRIGLARWTPNAPYIARLRDAAPQQAYAIYLDEKPSYENSTAFFLDAADVLFEKGQRELALRVLSNLAEMDLENRAVLRILGYRLLQAGEAGLAVPVFEKVLRIGEEEPQSWRDLGLAYAAAGQPQQAIDKLYEVALRPWAWRFPEIETIALAEMNAIIATSKPALDTSRIDPRLLKNLPLGLRVVMTWDADNSDMDLYVTDPNGDVSFYGSPLTRQGGRMSRDFTGGYGPEEFALRKAAPGKYRVQARYYGNRQQVLAGATTLQVRLVTGFGTPAQKEKAVTLRLRDRGETVFVGEFEVSAAGVR